MYPLHKNLWFYQRANSLWTERFLCKLYRINVKEPIPRFWWLFRLVQEIWHHLRDLSHIKLLSSLEMHLWQTRHVHPLFSFLWNFSSAAYHPVRLKYFFTRWISIFSSRRSSINRSLLEPSIAATTLTLFVKHSGKIPSFSERLNFEKGLGLLTTPPCFFCLLQSDNCGFGSPRSSFLFHFSRHFNFGIKSIILI